jgi:hypothetical protein
MQPQCVSAAALRGTRTRARTRTGANAAENANDTRGRVSTAARNKRHTRRSLAAPQRRSRRRQNPINPTQTLRGSGPAAASGTPRRAGCKEHTQHQKDFSARHTHPDARSRRRGACQLPTHSRPHTPLTVRSVATHLPSRPRFFRDNARQLVLRAHPLVLTPLKESAALSALLALRRQHNKQTIHEPQPRATTQATRHGGQHDCADTNPTRR